MFTYFFALIPLYVLVYRPLQNHWQPKAPGSEAAVGAINSSLVATDEPLYCAPQSYHTHILSQEPLIIYIESFLSPNESAHLTKVRYENIPPSFAGAASELASLHYIT